MGYGIGKRWNLTWNSRGMDAHRHWLMLHVNNLTLKWNWFSFVLWDFFLMRFLKIFIFIKNCITLYILLHASWLTSNLFVFFCQDSASCAGRFRPTPSSATSSSSASSSPLPSSPARTPFRPTLVSTRYQRPYSQILVSTRYQRLTLVSIRYRTLNAILVSTRYQKPSLLSISFQALQAISSIRPTLVSTRYQTPYRPALVSKTR